MTAFSFREVSPYPHTWGAQAETLALAVQCIWGPSARWVPDPRLSAPGYGSIYVNDRLASPTLYGTADGRPV